MTDHIHANEISVIIPVKNNQQGVDHYLHTFFEVTPPESYPKEITIVDNNSDVPVTIGESYPIPVRVIQCTRSGPAAARNAGADVSTGQWLLFNDSDCIPTSTTISGYCGENEWGHCAFQGMYYVLPYDRLASFYVKEFSSVPVPPMHPDMLRFPRELWTPLYMVTANCLVLRDVFYRAGKFDENITQVACEDVDLGVRIEEHGLIGICFDSIIEHQIEGGIEGFADRFTRYGKGTRYILKKHPQVDWTGRIQLKKYHWEGRDGIECPLTAIFFLCLRMGHLIQLPLDPPTD